MAFRITKRKGLNIKRIVTKLAVTVITLWVGGTIINEIGSVMNGTENSFAGGLSLIGWTVGDYLSNGTHWASECLAAGEVTPVTSFTHTSAPGVGTCISQTTGSGILTVVGLIGVAAIVMEFVSFSF